MFLEHLKIDKALIKTIVFDFDGVILDSMRAKGEAFYELLKPFGEAVANQARQHHLANGGMDRFAKIQYYYDYFVQQNISRKLLMQKANEFGELTFDAVVKSPFVPGVKDFIKSIKADFDLHIVSAMPEKDLLMICEKINITQDFQSILGTPNSKVANFELLMQKYGYQNRQFLYIGDSVNDFKACQEAKVHFVGYVPI